jgi:transposase InsO family protein
LSYPLLVPLLNEIWVLDFMSDALETGRRFRVFNVEDQLTREGLVAEVDTSLPGVQVAHALDRIVAERGKPTMRATPYPSGPKWTVSSGTTSRPASRSRTASWRALSHLKSIFLFKTHPSRHPW